MTVEISNEKEAGNSTQHETLEEAQQRADRAERKLNQLQDAPTATTSVGETTTQPQDLREDTMMAHLMDALAAGKDIGHYGRLVFAMVASRLLPEDEVVDWLGKDKDFGPAKAAAMVHQVEGRDYSPPRRERILEWQAEQDFPILPDPTDPDCGNVYKTLKFPDQVYDHIETYQKDKSKAAQ